MAANSEGPTGMSNPSKTSRLEGLSSKVPKKGNSPEGRARMTDIKFGLNTIVFFCASKF